jgi:hypothetical protein
MSVRPRSRSRSHGNDDERERTAVFPTIKVHSDDDSRNLLVAFAYSNANERAVEAYRRPEVPRPAHLPPPPPPPVTPAPAPHAPHAPLGPTAQRSGASDRRG